jgi:phosphoglycerate dehydrogenase-like enzyme
MLKELSNPSFPATGAPEPLDRRDGSGTGGRPPVQAKIGFVGLGHMGTAMAGNLAAAGARVIAYIRRPDQME